MHNSLPSPVLPAAPTPFCTTHLRKPPRRHRPKLRVVPEDPSPASGWAVTLGFGGVGFDVATPLVPGRLNVRGGAGFFSYTYNGTVSNEPISASLKLNNAKVMLDWFPFKGSFRLSAGTTVYNTTGMNGTVSVTPGTTLKIGNDYYLSDPAPAR